MQKQNELQPKIKFFDGAKAIIVYVIMRFWDFIIDYKNTLFPSYRELCKGREEVVNIIVKKEEKIKAKYIIYWIILVSLMLFMVYNIQKVIATKVFEPILVLHFNFQFWGLVIGFFGTLILVKGLIKNKYQIALEVTKFGADSTNTTSIIYTKWDTLIGLMFLWVSFALQICALFYNVA